MKSIFASALVVSGFIAGCGAAPNGEEPQSTSEDLLLADFEPGTSAHALPLHALPTREAPMTESESAVTPDVTPPAGAHLTYYGGPVLSDVKVVAVYWGSGVELTSHLDSFYKAIANSTYFDWLKEYDTPTQKIGRGSFAGAYTIKPSTTKKTLDDTVIQKEIAKQITAGHLPKPDANTLYMTHFPPGYTITMQGSSSCQEFCAYHGTFKKGSQMVFYGVVPDQGGACAGGCGVSPLQEGTTEVASHELIESVTDPGVGLATGNASPLAWYDQTNGEIGDICVGGAAKVSGYTVQVEWSNKRKACVSH